MKIVSLIGRPNVGKSSLFNRLVGQQHKAMTHDRPGVTRDRHYGILRLGERVDSNNAIVLVDTGGFYPDKVEENVPRLRDQKKAKLFNVMAAQAEEAISQSDLVLLVVDVREGLIPADKELVNYLRSHNNSHLRYHNLVRLRPRYTFYFLQVL